VVGMVVVLHEAVGDDDRTQHVCLRPRNSG
jgi:hypothetical protein